MHSRHNNWVQRQPCLGLELPLGPAPATPLPSHWPVHQRVPEPARPLVALWGGSGASLYNPAKLSCAPLVPTSQPHAARTRGTLAVRSKASAAPAAMQSTRQPRRRGSGLRQLLRARARRGLEGRAGAGPSTAARAPASRSAAPCDEAGSHTCRPRAAVASGAGEGQQVHSAGAGLKAWKQHCREPQAPGDALGCRIVSVW